MTRKEHDVEMRWKLTEFLESVRVKKDAIRRREVAQDNYEKALDKLLAEVPV
jgi:hypothetical protein